MYIPEGRDLIWWYHALYCVLFRSIPIFDNSFRGVLDREGGAAKQMLQIVLGMHRALHNWVPFALVVLVSVAVTA